MAGTNSSIDAIIADFDFLDEWEDRYRYVIELGRGLAPMDAADHREENLVRGCASQVWLVSRSETRDGNKVMRFTGDSDAMIVRGLVAIALALLDGKSPDDILDTDTEAVFTRLGLREHLTAQRSNGLRALVDRIRADASAALAD